MWKILNKFLGWDYIWLSDCGDHHIVRVKPLGRCLMGKVVCRNIFIDEEGNITGGYRITDWRPLTFEWPKKQ